MRFLIYVLLLISAFPLCAQDTFWDDFDNLDVSTFEAQNDLAFGSLNTNDFPSGRIYDRTDYNSKVLSFDGNNLTDKINYDDWLAMYNEMRASIHPSSNISTQPSVVKIWYDANQVYEETDDAIINGNLNVPIGIINYNYHKLKDYAVANNLIFADGQELKNTPGATENPFEQRKLFAAVPMIDTVESTTLNFKIGTDFYVQNDCSSWTSLQIDFGDGLGLQSVSTGNTYTVNYNGAGEKTLYFEMTCGSQVLRNYATFYVDSDDLSFTENNGFSYDRVWNIFENGRTGKLGIKFGCNNNSGNIRKPAIFVSGYNPFRINSLKKFYKKFDDGGLLTELRDQGYDICVFRPNDGADNAENSSGLLIDAIKYVNDQKALVDSHHETIVTGYSFGAVIARLALAKMEEDFFENGGEFHNSKLYFSYEGEHQGATVTLGYQHALRSILTRTSWHNPTANLLRAAYLYSILFQEGQQDFNSKLGKQMIINHFSQTGTPDNPSHGYHPDRQGLIDNFETTNHIHTKVNGYSVLTRNVAVSKGASDGTPRPYLEGESLFEFDKSRNIANQIFGYRHRGTVRALDGDTRVFARQRARRLLLAPVWINIVNERYQVDATAEPIENSNSSTIDNASTVRLAMKASFGILDDGVIVTEVKDPDAFVPVYSALDIRNRTPNDPYYDAKANNLLFTEPNEPNEYFGYPHLKYQNPLSVTPFEAVLVIPQNGEHSQGNDSQIPQIKDFFLSEIQPVELKLQNRRIGELIINYDADFEASKKIIAGKDITFQTPIGNFVIENNSNVRMQAGESITFEPGFSVEIGSTLSADIQSLDPSLCPNALGESDNVVLENRNNTPKSDYTTSLQANKAYDQTEVVKIFPNPSTGIVEIQSETPVKLVEVYDLMGKLKKRYNNMSTIELDTQSGVFVMRIILENGKNFSRKIVIK